jgi:hypothetical protein
VLLADLSRSREVNGWTTVPSKLSVAWSLDGSGSDGDSGGVP